MLISVNTIFLIGKSYVKDKLNILIKRICDLNVQQCTEISLFCSSINFKKKTEKKKGLYFVIHHRKYYDV